MRAVDVGDAPRWLEQRSWSGKAGLAVVLPDAAEVGVGVGAWSAWFQVWAHCCFRAVDGPVAFVQTDRLLGGRWVSKPALIGRAADVCDRQLSWHKIALRRQPGAVSIHRPTYSHVLGYGRPGPRTPDVIESGLILWRNGVGVEVALLIARWFHALGVETMVNPFCGHGTLLAAAEAVGLDAYGVDIDPARAAIARTSSIQMALA